MLSILAPTDKSAALTLHSRSLLVRLAKGSELSGTQMMTFADFYSLINWLRGGFGGAARGGVGGRLTLNPLEQLLTGFGATGETLGNAESGHG